MNYFLNSNPIQVRSSYKDLGVTFSNDLTWNSHIENIIFQSQSYSITYKAHLLKNIACICQKKSLSVINSTAVDLLFPSLASLPNQRYCCFVNPHRRATKYIANNSSLDYKNCLCSLNMLPLMYYLKLADIMFTVSSLKNPSSHFNVN